MPDTMPIYGCRLLEVTPLDPDNDFEPLTGQEKLVEVPQEASVEPDVVEGARNELRGGDKLVAIIEEEDYLVGLNITFNNAELDPEAIEIIAGGGTLLQEKAEVITGTEDGDNQILWRAVEGGTAGNSITVEIAATGVDGDPITIDVTADAITVTCDDTTNAGAVISAANADADVAALVDAMDAPGSDGSGLVVTEGPSNLADGSGDNVGYETPTIDDQHDGRTPFQGKLYVAQFAEGFSEREEIQGYVEFIFPYCKGRVPSISASGQTFMVPSFTLEAREHKHSTPPQGALKFQEVATSALPSV